MGKVYNNLITTTAGFNFPAKAPLDDREVVQSYSDLNTLVTNNQTYEGMSVYVVDDKKAYRLIDREWKPQGLGILEAGESESSIQHTDANALALGEASIAIGRKVISKGPGATAFGESGNSLEELKNHAKYPIDLTTATDDEIMQAWDEAHTRRITSVEADSTAAGLFSIALGDNSHVEGESTLANNTGHAEGRRTRATGKRTHAEGTDTAALGNNAHAEGQDSIAKGVAAHAEGYGTTAGFGGDSGQGEGAHAEGTYTKALATASHAEGTYTEARATASHTEGTGTIATQNYQHVQGKYNHLDTNGDAGDYAHIIGGGINADNRTNIHTVDWSGNAWYKGSIEAGNGKFQEVSGTKGTFSNDVLAGSISLQYVNKKIAASYADPSKGNESGVKMLGASSSNRYGLACGYRCQSNGAHAMAIGAGLIAKSTQVVVGLYNKEESGAAFVVGYGASEAESDRKNVFVVKTNGTGYLGDKKILVEGEGVTRQELNDSTVLESGNGENSIQQVGTSAQALSEEAIALGSNTLAGIKGFYWTEMSAWDASGDGSGYWTIDLKLNTAPYGQGGREPTAAEVEQCFAIGDTVTLHAGSKYDKRFTVVAYSTEFSPGYQLQLYTLDPTLTDESFVNEYKSGMGFSDNAIFCPAKPEAGVVDFGKYSFTAGHKTKALNYGATAFGRDTEAYGQYSTAVGRQTRAGYAAFAAGRYAYADGENSTATGLHVKATAQGAHAEGGTARSAEKDWTQALEPYAHAEGEATKARARAAHTEGYFTEVTSLGGHAQGRFNIPGDYAHIVGNGTEQTPANIHTVDWGGNAWYKGDVKAGNVSLTTTSSTANKALNKSALYYVSSSEVLNDRYESGAIGLQAKGSSRYGAALGWGCEVTGDHGMAFGACTWAKGGQTAVGKANAPEQEYLNATGENKTAIFMVGNGATDASANATTRSNAFAVLGDGTGYLGDKKILVEGEALTEAQVATLLKGQLYPESVVLGDSEATYMPVPDWAFELGLSGNSLLTEDTYQISMTGRGISFDYSYKYNVGDTSIWPLEDNYITYPQSATITQNLNGLELKQAHCFSGTGCLTIGGASLTFRNVDTSQNIFAVSNTGVIATDFITSDGSSLVSQIGDIVSQIGDIETALDNIIAIQESLIGGNA